MSPMSAVQPDPPLFRDRSEAGDALARALTLSTIDCDNALVIGLARGGVEVADAVAGVLDVAMDALAVRKVGHPWYPEYALGAVTPDGAVFLRDRDGLDRTAIDRTVARARADAAALDRLLHPETPIMDPTGRTCILVDDGLATGATMVAALRWGRGAGATCVVAAVPVGAAESLALLTNEADLVVCPFPVRAFGSVGRWYGSFEQVPTQRVLALIARRRRAGTTRASAAIGAQPDAVERAGVDSFPASDAPSWTGVGLPRAHSRPYCS
jgi:predicted phosphoribosyltransferase